METKNSVLYTAKVCYIISKVLYILCCIACVAFIIASILLAATHSAEGAVIFGTLALYSFLGIGLLWNVEGIFKSVTEEQTPFGEHVNHYLKKVGIFTILLSFIPAIIGSAMMRFLPGSELVFPISFAGIVAGIVILILCGFFRYGKDLQKNDDETL